MARPEKEAVVADLAEQLRNAPGAVLTEYRGLSVKQLQQLRRGLGEHARYTVVKNRLTKLAAREAGFDEFEELLSGPTAIAFIDGDVVAAAKGLRDFARQHTNLVIKGGRYDGQFLGASEIARLADLESRESLLARLAGDLQAPMQRAASLFNAPLAQVARAADGLRAQREEGEPPPAPAPATD